jgi:hypothetical protein
VSETFRPDVWLRHCALHAITSAPNAYQDFMLSAAPMTRQQHQRAGQAVEIDEYATRMASCDGDHITLQAISDCLQVCINVIKWQTKADLDVKQSSALASSLDVFVAQVIRPRSEVLPYLDPRANALQLNSRTLWLSLHGEVHFRSIHLRNGATVEEVRD